MAASKKQRQSRAQHSNGAPHRNSVAASNATVAAAVVATTTTTTTTTADVFVESQPASSYVCELARERKQLAAHSPSLPHALRLIDEELRQTRATLFKSDCSNSNSLNCNGATSRAQSHISAADNQDVSCNETAAANDDVDAGNIAAVANGELSTTTDCASELPRNVDDDDDDAAATAAVCQSEQVQLTEKVYVPVGEHPDYNFVGRLLGPRGMTAKQLETLTGCKIMIRGKGSMRDKRKEDANRGKPNWEHLNDELHVLVAVEDAKPRAEAKLRRALAEVRKLLVPIVDGEDELKKRQLIELAIINGTYRDSQHSQQQHSHATLNNAALHNNNSNNFELSSAASSSASMSIAPTSHASHSSRRYARQANYVAHFQQQQQQNYADLSSDQPSNSPLAGQVAVTGSSLSSGVTSTGSNTPNSMHLINGQHSAALSEQIQQQQHHQPQLEHQQQQHQQQHQQPPILMTAAVSPSAKFARSQQGAHLAISPSHEQVAAFDIAPRDSHRHQAVSQQEALLFAHQYHQYHAAMAAAAAAATHSLMPHVHSQQSMAGAEFQTAHLAQHPPPPQPQLVEPSGQPIVVPHYAVALHHQLSLHQEQMHQQHLHQQQLQQQHHHLHQQQLHPSIVTLNQQLNNSPSNIHKTSDYCTSEPMATCADNADMESSQKCDDDDDNCHSELQNELPTNVNVNQQATTTE